MSDTSGTYSFLPWLRLGIANTISSADADPAIALRATVPVELTLTGEKVDGSGQLSQSITRDVGLYGPGDIVGVDKSAIIKTEPAHWITNFEPNYLAYIDFADPDFLWRYTPAAPDVARHRLRPWLTLLVATDDEIEAASSQGGLTVINLKVALEQVFPPAEQLWAWANAIQCRFSSVICGLTLGVSPGVTRGYSH